MANDASHYEVVYWDNDLHDGEAKPATPSQLVWLVKVAVIVAAFFAIWAAFEYRRTIAHALFAVETTGTITQKWSRDYTYLGFRTVPHRRASRYVMVEFDDKSGYHRRYRKEMYRDTWNSVSVGSPVQVWYVPSEPANFNLDYRERPEEWRAHTITAVFFVVLGAWALFEYYATRPNPYLSREGRRARLKQRALLARRQPTT